MRAVLVCLLLCGAVPAFAQMGGAPAVADTALIQSVKTDALQSYYGVTFCTDAGVSSFIMTGLSAMDDAATRAHEAKHREQRARFPSCRAWQNYYQTPRGNLESEAEAYTAGWCVAVRMNADPISLRQSNAEKIEHGLGGSVINRYEIIQALRRYEHCK